MLYKKIKYKLSSLIITPVIFIFCIFNLYSFDYTDFILNSNRNLNDHIYEMLLESDLDDSLEISRLLGIRNDPYIEDILFNILSDRQNIKNYELFLENILKNVSEQNTENILFWLEENKYAYFELIKQSSTFSNPYLKSYIFSFTEYLQISDLNTYIMNELQSILNIIINNEGYLLPGKKRLLFEILRILELKENSDFNEIILNILEETRDKDIAEHCRNSIAAD